MLNLTKQGLSFLLVEQGGSIVFLLLMPGLRVILKMFDNA
jgi:hypothetical protein